MVPSGCHYPEALHSVQFLTLRVLGKGRVWHGNKCLFVPKRLYVFRYVYPLPVPKLL